MSLSEIKRKLYKKEAEKDLASHAESIYNPERKSEFPETPADLSRNWGKTDANPELEQKKQKTFRVGAIALGIIIFFIVILTGLYFYRLTSFSEERVKAQISGPKDAGSGKFLTYAINWENDNRADLKNTVLKVNYPDYFKPEDNSNFVIDGPTTGHWDMGTVEGHTNGKLILNGRIYSPQGALVYLKTELYYTPAVFSSPFTARSQIGVNVISTPISLEVMAPQNISTGDAVNYLITFKNNGNDDFENLKIKVDYPGGFTFSRSEPASLESNNVWYVGRLSPGQEGKIVISGKIEGNRDEVKTVKSYIGSVENGSFVAYNEEDADTRISSSPLAISQTVNGMADLSVDPNQNLSFSISFKNEGQIGLRDVIVTENIDSTVLDYSTLQMEGGYFDESTKTITWKSSDYPILKNLEPGAGGSIDFSIKVKDIIPIGGPQDKNFVISSVAKIDSPDIPTPIHMNKIIAGNKMDTKLNSKLILAVNGYYTDPNIQNSGPIPPRVGSETSYTIHWAVTNTTNDLSGVRVESSLPTGVVPTGLKVPEGANLSFNERNNTVVWEIGNMAAGTGILSAPKEVSFQIKVKPSVESLGKELDLLGPSTIYGTDYFTGVSLTSLVDGKTTYLREDVTIIPGTGTRVAN